MRGARGVGARDRPVRRPGRAGARHPSGRGGRRTGARRGDRRHGRRVPCRHRPGGARCGRPLVLPERSSRAGDVRRHRRDARGRARVATAAGINPPTYYALVGVPVRLLGLADETLAYRFVAVCWNALVVALVLWRARRRSPSPIVADGRRRRAHHAGDVVPARGRQPERVRGGAVRAGVGVGERCDRRRAAHHRRVPVGRRAGRARHRRAAGRGGGGDRAGGRDRRADSRARGISGAPSGRRWACRSSSRSDRGRLGRLGEARVRRPARRRGGVALAPARPVAAGRRATRRARWCRRRGGSSTGCLRSPQLVWWLAAAVVVARVLRRGPPSRRAALAAWAAVLRARPGRLRGRDRRSGRADLAGPLLAPDARWALLLFGLEDFAAATLRRAAFAALAVPVLVLGERGGVLDHAAPVHRRHRRVVVVRRPADHAAWRPVVPPAALLAAHAVVLIVVGAAALRVLRSAAAVDQRT